MSILSVISIASDIFIGIHSPIIITMIILLQRYPFSNTQRKLNYIQFTARIKNKNADLKGSRSLREHTFLFHCYNEALIPAYLNPFLVDANFNIGICILITSSTTFC